MSKCQAELCYYIGKLDQYDPKEDQRFVSNAREVDELGWDISQLTPPFEFRLCKVCWENSGLVAHKTCVDCGSIMVDQGIECHEHWYCRNCLSNDRIIYLISTSLKVTREATRKAYTRSWDEWKTKKDPAAHEILSSTLRVRMINRELHRRAQLKKKLKKKLKRKRKVAKGIQGLAPQLELTECERVVKRHRIRKVPDSVEHLIILLAKEIPTID